MIEESKINQIKETIDIVQIVSTFVNMRRRGNNYFGHCPFHNERTPSFSVSPTKQMFKCFGCGNGGDVIQFLMDHQGMTFPDAMMFLSEQTGIELKLEADPNERLYEVMEHWNQEFKDELKKNKMAMNYLEGRGITREEIQKFEIGFCSYRTPDEAILIGYDDEYTLKRCGIVSDNGFLLFSSRITFPIRDGRGKLIGFSGRALSSSTRTNKYVNSRSSTIYQKDRALYGLKMARKLARLRGEMNVIEGYTDVIAMHRVGFSNSVAQCGTAFTAEHAQEIKRICSRVIFWYDGDAAGLKASKRAMDIALEAGLKVSVKRMPEGQDVYSFVQDGGDLTKIPRMSLAQMFGEVSGDAFDKAEQVHEMVDSLVKINDPITRDFELKEICRNFGVSYRVLHQQVQLSIKQRHNHGKNLRRPTQLGRSRAS